MKPTPLDQILFVDDDENSRHALGLLFRDVGYRVLEASSGHEALHLASHEPAIVILDVNLPDLSGFEVCRLLRDHPATRHAGLIHLSGVHVGLEDRTFGLEAGADAYLLKPVDPRELLAHVRALLRVRAAEEAYRHAAREWRATFDAIHDVVCLLDNDGRILRCNRALALLLRRDFQDLLGQPFAEVLRQGLALPLLPVLPVGAGGSGQEIQLGDRWFHVTSDPLIDSGVRCGTVYVLEDVTRRVLLEEQLRQSSRLEAIGRLAGGVAHDFNNLLTAILGNTSLLLGALPPSAEEHDLARTIERAAWRAAELTRQLLGFSRQTLLWPEPLDVADLLTRVAETTRERLRVTNRSAIRVLLSQGEDPWPVLGDVGHLTQILQQLCDNAAEAMPEGGVLLLAVGNVEVASKEAERRAEAREGAFVRISVQDSGVGIDPEVQDKIFDPFFTTKAIGNGTGLGLAMVHGIVKQHQGWVECHSAVGQGTRFDVYLPRLARGHLDAVADRVLPAVISAS